MAARPEDAFTVEADMASAGAELVALSYRMAEHPAFAEDAERVRRIGGWAAIGRPTDVEKGIAAVLGSMMAAMGRRGFRFSRTSPMVRQFVDFLDAITVPNPGEPDYVDPRGLDPSERRDEFTAHVEIGEVHRWTGLDDITRAVSPACMIWPDGRSGRATVHAEGDLTSLMHKGRRVVLVLRWAGGSLEIVGTVK